MFSSPPVATGRMRSRGESLALSAAARAHASLSRAGAPLKAVPRPVFPLLVIFVLAALFSPTLAEMQKITYPEISNRLEDMVLVFYNSSAMSEQEQETMKGVQAFSKLAGDSMGVKFYEIDRADPANHDVFRQQNLTDAPTVFAVDIAAAEASVMEDSFTLSNVQDFVAYMFRSRMTGAAEIYGFTSEEDLVEALEELQPQPEEGASVEARLASIFAMAPVFVLFSSDRCTNCADTALDLHRLSKSLNGLTMIVNCDGRLPHVHFCARQSLRNFPTVGLFVGGRAWTLEPPRLDLEEEDPESPGQKRLRSVAGAISFSGLTAWLDELAAFEEGLTARNLTYASYSTVLQEKDAQEGFPQPFDLEKLDLDAQIAYGEKLSRIQKLVGKPFSTAYFDTLRPSYNEKGEAVEWPPRPDVPELRRRAEALEGRVKDLERRLDRLLKG